MHVRSSLVLAASLALTAMLTACGSDEAGNDTAAPAASASAAVPASPAPASPAPVPSPSASTPPAIDEAEPDGDTFKVIGAGSFQFDYAGAVGNIEIPLAQSDKAVSDLEAFRKRTGSDKVGYVKVIVDNTQGTDDINMYQVVAVTSAGEQVEFNGLDEAISIWQERLPEGDSAGYNRGNDLINDNQFFLLPGAKGTALLINPEPVKDIARVFVYPAGGMDKVEAYKVR